MLTNWHVKSFNGPLKIVPPFSPRSIRRKFKIYIQIRCESFRYRPKYRDKNTGESIESKVIHGALERRFSNPTLARSQAGRLEAFGHS
jgi:hypothetical protein